MKERERAENWKEREGNWKERKRRENAGNKRGIRVGVCKEEKKRGGIRKSTRMKTDGQAR